MSANEVGLLSALDDYLIHQTPEPIRYVNTSDRNFYDRYYFNMHASDARLFLIWGFGNYPNLGVQDAFVTLRLGDKQYVLRASSELESRAESMCGPIRIEVLEGLKRLRLVVEPNESGIEADLIFEGAHPPTLEPRLNMRRFGRVVWDHTRYDQNGFYSGRLKAPNGETFDVKGPNWQGYRDRSWGIRPVGEPEPKGIMASKPVSFIWFYCSAQFKDFTLMLKAHDFADGKRGREEALRVWNDPDRGIDHLGPLDYELTLSGDKQWITHATIRCPKASGGALTVEVEQLLPLYLFRGTGYDDEDLTWRHGGYQGPLKVESLTFDVGGKGPHGPSMVDAVGRFTTGGETGHGLLEYGFIGSHPKYGIEGAGYWNNSKGQ